LEEIVENATSRQANLVAAVILKKKKKVIKEAKNREGG
jgi:hypothetical protein